MGRTRRYEKSWAPRLRNKKKRKENTSLNKNHTPPSSDGEGVEEDYGEEETFERFHSSKDSDRV